MPRTLLTEKAEQIVRKRDGLCEWCNGSPIRETLDGDPLCQGCCDQWARAEQGQ